MTKKSKFEKTICTQKKNCTQNTLNLSFFICLICRYICSQTCDSESQTTMQQPQQHAPERADVWTYYPVQQGLYVNTNEHIWTAVLRLVEPKIQRHELNFKVGARHKQEQERIAQVKVAAPLEEDVRKVYVTEKIVFRFEDTIANVTNTTIDYKCTIRIGKKRARNIETNSLMLKMHVLNNKIDVLQVFGMDSQTVVGHFNGTVFGVEVRHGLFQQSQT